MKTCRLTLFLLWSLLAFSVSARIEEPGEGVFTYADYAPYADKPIDVHYFIPSDGDAATMPILFVMQGADRGWTYLMKTWKQDAQKYRFIVVIPVFTKELYPVEEYQEMGVYSGEGILNAPERTAAVLIDKMFERFRDEIGGRQEHYSFYGHSAGGQFIHRALLLHDSPYVERSVVGSPGWYTFPDNRGMRYPYGVTDLPYLNEDDLRRFVTSNAWVQVSDGDTLRESLEDVKGVLGDTAEARMNTVQGSIKLLQSAWEGFILSLSGSKGVIKWVIDQATKIVSSLTEFVQGPRGILMQQARENGNIDFSSSDYYKGMGSEELQKVKKTYEQGLAAAEAELERLEGKSGFRKFFDNALKAEIDEAKAAVEFEKTRLASFESFVASGTGNTLSQTGEAPPEGGSGGNGGGNKTKGKKTAFDPVKEAKNILAEIEKEWEEYYKKQDQLEKEGAEIMIAAEESKTAAALMSETKRYNEELRKFKDSEIEYENKTEIIEAIEKKHQNNLAKIRLEALSRYQSDLEIRHNIARQDINNEASERIAAARPNYWKSAAISKEMNEALVKEDLSYLETLKQSLETIVATGIINGVSIPEEEKAKFELKLKQTIGKINELTAQDKANSSGIWGGTGGGSLFGVSEAQWGQFFYNLDHGKLKADDLANAMSAIGNLANEGFQLASKAIANTNAKEQNAFKEYQKIQEKEKKALKNRLDSGLMSQAQYDAEIERMNAEAEAKEEAMKLKQAKREKSLNIVQSIINTALGVTKTLAQWGIPAGIAPAAIMSAMGAAQTALIAAQPVTGKEEGGFVNTRREQDGKRFKARLSPDKRGFISSPTILVGENGGEYVIPAAGLDNPTLRPLLATIETARQAGRLKDLNFEAVYPLSSPIGRESGGYVRALPPESVPNVAASTASGDSARLSEAIETLVRRLSKPIKADVSMTGRNGIIEKTEEYNRAKKRGQYNG